MILITNPDKCVKPKSEKACSSRLQSKQVYYEMNVMTKFGSKFLVYNETDFSRQLLPSKCSNNKYHRVEALSFEAIESCKDPKKSLVLTKKGQKVPHVPLKNV